MEEGERECLLLVAGVGEKTYVRWSGKVCCLSQDPKEIVSEIWRT